MPRMLNTSSETGFDMSDNSTSAPVNVTSGLQAPTGVLAVVIVTVVATISIATIFGNLAVIICILRNKNLTTVYNIYAASLALADLVVGVIVMTCMSLYTFYGYWPLGAHFCTVWVLFDFTCCTISMLHLDAVAFDRYKSVTSPLVYRTTFTKRRAVKISVFMWVLGVSIWLPPILYFRMTDQHGGLVVENDCYFIPDKYFIVGQVTAAYYIPMVFMVTMYFLLFNSLNKRHHRTGKASVPPSVATINSLASNDTSDDDSFRTHGSVAKLEMKGTITPKTLRPNTIQSDESVKISAQNRRCISTLGALIVVFLLCWLPFVIFWPLAAFCESCVPADLYTASYWLAYANSFVNPYIYFLLNRDFREAFSRTFLGRRRTRSSYGNTLSQYSDTDDHFKS